MLREAKAGVSGWLWALGLSLTALIWGLFTAGLALGVGRMARRGHGLERPAPVRAPALAG